MLERLRGISQQLGSQGLLFYKGLTKGRKIGLGIGILVIIVAFIAALMWRPQKQYEVAYTGLSQEDKTAMLAFLKKSQVVDFRLEGDTISFPIDQALDIKMRLAEDGLPNSGMGPGWEKFDERMFGATDFDQKINKMRAIQSELQRTINRLEPVDASRVHIVLPEQAVFTDEKKQSTASIYMRLKTGKTLTQRQIQGVLHLVARAVEGLDPQNIAIIDQEGNMLTRPEDDGGFDKATNTQREYQKRVERELSAKIREILGRVVGYNKVVATVQAELDFKKVETTIQDVDPERSAVIGSVRNEQSAGGNGFNPTGVPGSKSNLPGEKEDTGAGGGMSNQSKQSSETLNYEVKKTLSKVVEPVGSLKKVSAAVLVDNKLIAGKPSGRTTEEMTMITKLVKSAIGFQEGRDTLSVETTQFELDEFAVAEQDSLTARRTSLLQTGIIAALVIACLGFLFYAVIRPYFHWLTFDPEKRSREQFAVVDYELERSGSAAKRVQVHEEVPFEKLTPKEQIMYMARHDPKKTTEALRQLLSPQHIA